MGFFKRILSLGSRKSKKSKQKQVASRSASDQVDAEGRIIRVQAHETDADANRLLRTASARLAEAAVLDASNVPPLPPLVTHLTAVPPSSPALSATSIQRSNTYVVKVHSRTLHSRTEFPNANPRIDDYELDEPGMLHSDDNRKSLKDVLFTPRDHNRLHVLRRDPSVASLLNMYDDKGCLDANAFSNTPPTPAPITDCGGHEQIKRSGSTLRQLLGNPDQRGEATEGDISWAERFLMEGGSASSSTSSLPLHTPSDREGLLSNDLYKPHVFTNIDGSSNHDLSRDRSASVQYPAISSMEVEYSRSTDVERGMSGIHSVAETTALISATDPKTPQRASEVFGFLTERRKSLRERTTSHRLPALIPYDSHAASPDESQEPSNISHAQVQRATLVKLSLASVTPANGIYQSSVTVPSTYLQTRTSTRTNSDDQLVSTQLNPDVPTNAAPSQPVPLTRVSTGTSLIDSSKVSSQPTMIPRGPRPRRSKQHLQESSNHAGSEVQAMSSTHPTSLQNIIMLQTDSRASASAAGGPRGPHKGFSKRGSVAANENAFTSLAPRKQRRDISRRSISANFPDGPARRPSRAQNIDVNRDENDKENSAEMSSASSPKAARKRTKARREHGQSKTAPTTPLRSRPIFDLNGSVGAVTPSPTSSSELSPVTRDMMASLRKQRMRAREVDSQRRLVRQMRAAS